MRTAFVLSALAALCTQVTAHLVITYPGWRGDNLHTTGTVNGLVPEDGLGVSVDNSTHELLYPYGMQWIYPCTYPTFPNLRDKILTEL